MLKLVLLTVVWVGVQSASHHHTEAPTTTPLPDADRLKKLEMVTEQLARQMMLQQLYIEETARSSGDSGLKQLRLRKNGIRAYDAESFAGHSIAALHDHSNLERTPGLGEMIAVLNGVEFRTRHNDYKVRMPVHNSSYHEVEDIPFPPIPPSVTNQNTLEKQMAEMREYFKAWRDQDHHHRDYRPYFKPVLCYLEGAWTLDRHLEEPFSSDRHAIDASSWFDLQEKVRYTSSLGDRLNSQNLAFLPTSIYNVTDGVPSFAQWNYRILCHPIKGEVNRSHLVPIEDMQHRMGYKADWEHLLKSRMARFEVNDKSQNHFYVWNELDDWMHQIPGKNNYGFHKTDSVFGLPKLYPSDMTPLNVGYYHRTWKVGAHDAMGDTLAHRGYSDRSLFVAETTQPRVAPSHIKHCYRSSQTHRKVCDDVTKRVSYAIPLEIIFLTPLNTWNPYNIEYRGKFYSAGGQIVTKDGRNGGTDLKTAYNGTHSKAYYYTPVEFFAGAEVSHDPADTSRAATGVLDRQGNLRLMKSSGIRTILPNIEGVGTMRLRYPIMPLNVEGSTAWKEVEALRDVVMDMEGNMKYIRKPPPGIHTYSAMPSHHTGK